MYANHSIDDLIRLAETYAQAKRLSLTTVSLYAAGQGRFFDRLKAGRTLTYSRAAKLSQWFADNWPTGTAWPKGIKRPAKQKKTEAA